MRCQPNGAVDGYGTLGLGIIFALLSHNYSDLKGKCQDRKKEGKLSLFRP